MRLNVHYHGERIGELLELEQGAWFQYDREWLSRGLELSPIKLPATSAVLGPWEEPEQYYLAGLFADSLPDNYGFAVIIRRFKEAGLPDPTPLQMLAFLGSRTMGALTYAPGTGEVDKNRTVDLIAAAKAARQVVEYDYSQQLDTDVIASGGSAGGAQPKILIAMDPQQKRIVTGSDQIPQGMGAWLLKFDLDAGQGPGRARVEHAYFQMARAGGLNTPETALVPSSDGGMHFAIQRFDRQIDRPNHRIHSHTLSGLLHRGFKRDGWDYDHLLRATRELTSDIREVESAWRQMVFNVLAHNQDDHAKNFSFLMDDDGQWSLAPAYDLTYVSSLHGGQALNINGKRLFTASDIVELGRKHSIAVNRMREIHDEVANAINRWPEFAASADVRPGILKSYQGGMESVRKSLRLDAALSPGAKK
ncbi:type II toxin-antitoxin system HipA family toxin [Cerasicoccus fimbriatus]|uniref:type II toxin-antitoxin system HipA family toxin n=1 Tax=Cerasicoccus fimbriatus TaxID=3014554 RepID=UPI0022B2E6F8|nr:type II toxin-antitoxin system HipA family toxin [Cerasicoccus sp. TK19100]